MDTCPSILIICVTIQKTALKKAVFSAPGRIRICNLLLRKQTLCPIALQELMRPRLSADALDFMPYIETLSNVVQQSNTPLTIGVFGSWGSGKTSLMGMVGDKLPENFTVAWFDAWNMITKRHSGALSC